MSAERRRRIVPRLVVAIVALASSSAVAAQEAPPVPRLADGKPDFTGVWDHPRVGDITQSSESDACAGGSRGCRQVGAGPLPFTALGREVRARNDTDYFDYGAHCLPWGFVRAYGTPYPHAYVHSVERLAILWEQDNAWHMVPTDGRALSADLEPTWRGTSVGRWEGDTLVIETRNFNGKGSSTNIHTIGSPPYNNSPISHEYVLTERIKPTGPNTMLYTATVHDPVIWTADWTVELPWVREDDYFLYEYACAEDNVMIRNYINSSRAERGLIPVEGE